MLLTLSALAFAAPPLEVAAFEGAHAQRPAWSADGTRLSVEANDHAARKVTLHLGPATGPLTPVKPPVRASSDLTAGFATTARAVVVHEIAWPPAGFGPTFAYVAANDAQDYDLYLDGVGKIAPSPAADGGPAWSPDGAWIAFTSARTGEGDLYLANTAALEAPPRQLTSLGGASELYPAWSRDGKMLAWVAHSRTGDNLFLLPSLDGRPVKLTTWTGNQVRPRFSPTADKLAFYANHEDPTRFDLYVVDAASGAEPTLLLRGVVPDAAGPSFSPDGARLVVVRDDADTLDPIVAVPVGGGPAAVLALGTVGNGDLAVTRRDGVAWIAWVAQGRVGDPIKDYKRLFAAPLP